MASYNSEAPVLDNYQAVVSAFSEFLIVAIHSILYERNLYPQTSFIKARKYNYPVRQSRHPKLCKWIMDAVASVEVEMLKVRKTLMCVIIVFRQNRQSPPLEHSHVECFNSMCRGAPSQTCEVSPRFQSTLEYWLHRALLEWKLSW